MGLTVASIGGNVVVTDLAAVLPDLCRSNIQFNTNANDNDDHCLCGGEQYDESVLMNENNKVEKIIFEKGLKIGRGLITRWQKIRFLKSFIFKISFSTLVVL